MERFEIDLTLEEISVILLGLESYRVNELFTLAFNESKAKVNNSLTPSFKESIVYEKRCQVLQILNQKLRFIQNSFGDASLQDRITELCTPQ